MASSSSVPSVKKDEEPRNWAELPFELTFLILNRLSVIDILQNAQKVCKPWHRVCKDPLMWRKIDIHNFGVFARKKDLESMCRNAVDRSQGCMLEMRIWVFGTDDLLNYIADRSSNLRSLKLPYCFRVTDEGVAKAVVKLPLLEELDITCWAYSGESLRVVGQSCPQMKTLKINDSLATEFLHGESNDIAIAIGETMPQLRYLELERHS